MITTAELSASTTVPIDRRRSARLDVLDQLDGQLVMYNIPVRLRDISEGGVATESAIALPIRSKHLLRLTTPAGVEVMIAGTVMHQRLSVSAMGRRVFVTGFEFADDRSQNTAQAVQTLLDAVAVELDD